MTGEAVDADTAVEIGLVSDVVLDEDLVAEAEALGRVLAAKDPDVLRTIRATIDAGLTAPLDGHLDTEADAVADLLGRRAFTDGTSRFA